MKKLLPILCILLCLAGLTACGADPKDMDYNGYTYDQLRSEAEGLLNSLETLDDETRQQIEASADEMIVTLVHSYDELKEESGALVEAEDLTVTKSGKTLTSELKLKFEEFPALLTFVYNYNDMRVTAITVAREYSTGYKMQRALLNTVMGMGTVFIMLIVISLCISCFKVIPYLEQRAKAKKRPPVVIETQHKPFLAEPYSIESSVEKQDDLELTAVIAAAIAAATGQSADDFVVRSIKRR